ncbi:hypothetical protein FAZ69_03400 [Trinickia terrae]|uniref:Type III secretion protein n=1 Tax=Trinickia terrae TaxID=2571161 RepID=A0A4U1ICY8_9BURK|nr:type III secretion protein HrpB4 [Trinickia terrae]TKC91513.1 hypothetical protein FAZ69_03400 [Trinickia terrae]
MTAAAAHPLIRMLAAFEARVRDLAGVLGDASREFTLPDEGRDPALDAHAHAIRAEAARRIWFGAPVPLAAFLEPGNRIAILAPDALRRLSAARALFACRDAVRRCVDRRVRDALAASIGPNALAVLLALPAEHGGADHALPADVSSDALARDGWRALAASGACSNASLRNLVELNLAMASDEQGPAPDIARLGADDVDARWRDDAMPDSANETNRFFSAASGMFPELQWLFG